MQHGSEIASVSYARSDWQALTLRNLRDLAECIADVHAGPPGYPDETGANFIAKYSHGGRLLWWRQFGEQPSVDVGMDGAGNVYAIGQARVDGALVPALLKYGVSGELLYVKNLSALGGPGVPPAGIAVESDGELYLVYSDSATRTFLEKRGSDGSLAWKQDFDAGVNATAGRVAVASDDVVYVTGTVTGDLGPSLGSGAPLGGRDAFVVQYQALNGQRNWTRRLGSAADDQGGPVAVDGQGHAYLAYSSWDGTDWVGQFSKITRANQLAWVQPVPQDMTTFSLATGPNGTLFLAGSAINSAPRGSLMLSKHDALGRRTWATASTGGNERSHSAQDVAVDGSGNADVAGRHERNEESGSLTRYSPESTPRRAGTVAGARPNGASLQCFAELAPLTCGCGPEGTGVAAVLEAW